MEIKLIIDDEDAKELLERLKSKHSIVWPTSMFTEKEAEMMVDIQKREMQIFKAKVITLPIRL